MKPIENYENLQAIGAREKLPAGGYVCKILDAKVVETDWGERLEISLDIVEGEYHDFYARNYANQNKDKKWKGVARVSVPRNTADEKHDFYGGLFKASMEAIQDSNDGYFWNWDEATLVGKKVGAIFQDREWDFNNKRGFTAQWYRFAPVDDIRSGSFDIPEKKMLDAQEAPLTSYSDSNPFPTDYDSSLPF